MRTWQREQTGKREARGGGERVRENDSGKRKLISAVNVE